MTQTDKEQIRVSTAKLVDKIGSQAKAAKRLRISTANMSHIIQGKNLSSISDDMWRKIRIGLGLSDEWVTVETHAAKTLTYYLEDARDFAAVHGIINHAGSGKTHVMKRFADANANNVFAVKCDEFWSQKDFLEQLLTSIGKDARGLNKRELMNAICEGLTNMETPLIIIDEADKLQDKVLLFFITLYNRLENYCGIVIMATDFLQKRILKGVSRNKQGFNEIYSRLGRRFIELPQIKEADVRLVCEANGVTSNDAIEHIAKTCDNDLRRVEKLIRANKVKAARKEAGNE